MKKIIALVSSILLGFSILFFITSCDFTSNSTYKDDNIQSNVEPEKTVDNTQPTSTPEDNKDETKENESTSNETEDSSTIGLNHIHIQGNTVEENRIDAKCTTDGSYDEVIYCSECKEELSRTHHTIIALNHDYQKTDETYATFENDGSITYTCSRCGDTYTEKCADKLIHHYSNELSYDENSHWYACIDSGYVNLKKDEQNHELSDWIIDKEATEIEYGLKHKKCVCGYKLEETIDKKEFDIESNLSFELSSNKKYYIVSAKNKNMKICIIPRTYNNLPVIKIGDLAFFNCTSLATIVIPDSVTSIGKSAFSYCKSLATITIPDSVTTISDSAFRGCESLETITIPNGVTKINDNTFYECKSLTTISIPNSVTSIGEYAFIYCKSLETITIPDSVKSIGRQAFDNCESLTTIAIPDSVKSIGVGAFLSCSSLTTITIPNSVTSIEQYIFSNCISLATITIPDSITEIGQYAFDRCRSLTKVTMSNSVKSIGDHAFDSCISLTTITIPDSVTRIGFRAFYGCTLLTTIAIPNSVTSIDTSAFENCYRLVEVINKSSLNITKGSSSYGYVGYYALNIITDEIDSKGFETTSDGLVIYDGNTVVNYNGNEGKVTISNNVTTINQYAFRNCTSLDTITFDGTISQWNSITKGYMWNSNVYTNSVICTDGVVYI